MRNKKNCSIPAIALAAGCSLAACGGNSHTSSPSVVSSSAAAKAKSDASAVANSKVTKAQETQLEDEFIVNVKASFNPAHPVKSVQIAVQKTFPKGDTAKIESYAVAHFTPSVLTTSVPGSARDLYAAGVTSYAISQGAVK